MPSIEDFFSSFKKCCACKEMKGIKDYDLKMKCYIVFVDKGVHKKEMYRKTCKNCLHVKNVYKSVRRKK